jgi:hypothetical protein
VSPIALLAAGKKLFSAKEGRNVLMVKEKEIIHSNNEDVYERDLKDIIIDVMVTEAASSDHPAVRSLRHFSSMGDELDMDETHSHNSEGLNKSEVDTVTGGLDPLGILKSPGQATRQGGALSESTKNWMYPSLVGGSVALGVGAISEAYGVYGKSKITGAKH